MKKGLFLTAFFVFALLSLPVFATAIQINASEDTFVTETNGIIGSTNYSSYLNYGNNPVAEVFRVKSGGLDTDVRTFLKFSNTALQTKIIDSIYLNYRGTSNCGTFASRIYLQNSDAWNEYNITYDNMPSLDTSEGNALKGINSTGASNTRVVRLNSAPPPATQNSSQLQFGSATYYAPNAELFDDLYNDDYTSLETYKTDSCGATPNGASMAQKEGNNTANISLQVTLVDLQQVTTLSTDTPTLYYDFETQFISTSAFPQADFYWNPSTNVLTPIQPAVVATTESSNANTLSTMSCSGYSPYSTTNIGTINIPSGSYSVICFDLKNAHNGNQFYGAIKIFNNTNVRSGIGAEFDFYSALYSSALATFSPATFNPSPQEAATNLTVTWTSSQNLSTGLRFRFLQNGVFSAFATIENPAQTMSHQIIIPSNLMFATLYEYQLYGSDANGTTFTTQAANFTAIGTYTTGTSSGNSNITYFDFETGISSPVFFTGADFALDTVSNISEFYTSGILWNGTLTPLMPKSFITFESTNANTLLSLDCRAAPAYSLGRTTYLNPAVQGGAYPVFCFDLSSAHGGSQIYGAIKITQMHENGNSSFYWAMYSPNFVTFYSVVKNPTTPQSDRAETISWQTSIPLTSQLQYSYQLANHSGYTSYAMLEDTSAFRTTHALTIPADQMFLGDYNFFLSGTDANGTGYSSPVFNFTVVNQSSGGSIGNPVGNFLGISTEAALIVVSLILTLIGTIAAGVLTRTAIIPVFTFLIGIMIFTAMSWLPLIYGIVLGILAIFVTVKFISDIVAGTQGT